MPIQPPTHEKLRWGLLATGRIASTFAEGLTTSRTGFAQAAASRDLSRAQTFATQHGIPHAHGSYEALLTDREIDAVYISTPHPQHCEWAVRAAEAGKHILCEKPLAMDLAEATRIVEAARANDVLLMEAFMYRCHPQTQRVIKMVRSGTLGIVQHIEATFGFRSKYDPASRLWNKSLGGGGILDVGCYALSGARLVAGAALGQPFADPISLAGAGALHPESGADVHAVATLGFPGGITAQIGCGVGLQFANQLVVHGTAGRLTVPSPFLIRSPARIEVTLFETKQTEILEIPADHDLYTLEADAVGDALAAGARETTAMPIADTLGNLAALDQWRAAIGLSYS